MQPQPASFNHLGQPLPPMTAPVEVEARVLDLGFGGDQQFEEVLAALKIQPHQVIRHELVWPHHLSGQIQFAFISRLLFCFHELELVVSQLMNPDSAQQCVLPHQDKSFDLIIASMTLHHVRHSEQLVKEV